MEFNVDKCTTLHIGNKNINYSYEMNGRTITSVPVQKDLGVIVNNKLKCNNQCISASKTANKMLGFISRSFDCKASHTLSGTPDRYP